MVWDFDLIFRIGLIAIVFNWGPVVLFFILRPLFKEPAALMRRMWQAEMDRMAKNRSEGKGYFDKNSDDDDDDSEEKPR